MRTLGRVALDTIAAIAAAGIGATGVGKAVAGVWNHEVAFRNDLIPEPMFAYWSPDGQAITAGLVMVTIGYLAWRLRAARVFGAR